MVGQTEENLTRAKVPYEFGMARYGETALIHIGQSVMAFGGKVDYFVDTVFNHPTLAEAYKVAAFDGLNKL
jgi:NAD(P) transhydrogenase